MKAKKVTAPTIDTGIAEKDRARIAEGLSRLLADTYTLYLKTHNFHWNVKGPMFNTLHLMFMDRTTNCGSPLTSLPSGSVRSGSLCPGTYAAFGKLSSIAETPGVPTADQMIRLLVEGNEAVVRTARKVFPAGRQGRRRTVGRSADYQRMQVHEKNAWMLRSLLET